MHTYAPFALLLALGACNSGNDASVPGDMSDSRPFAEIAPGEVVHFTGTEPFWGGQVQGNTLLYTTPTNQEGTRIEVERFAGRVGVSFSGALGDQPFDMMITKGACSDGMSDRTYPYTVTLEVEGETRTGCAWSQDAPFSGPERP